MKPDLRDDLDQHAKLQDIIDILVAAGYFRARIKTLSPFDKIIGGMAWAIQVSSHNLDIDLFFQDSLDIGHKIALTEKIVHALLAMNCPYRIEPHQIQGLDCIHILPVIQWLVRTSIEIMQQHAAFNKLIAARKFKLIKKQYIEHEHNTCNVERKRLFRFKGEKSQMSVEDKCKTVLLEYGLSDVNHFVGNSSFLQSDASARNVPVEDRFEAIECRNQNEPQDLSSHIMDRLFDAQNQENSHMIVRLEDSTQSLIRDLEVQLDNIRSQISKKKQAIHELEKRHKENNTYDLIQEYKTTIEEMDNKIKKFEEESLHFDDISERKRLAGELLLIKKQKETFKRECRSEKEKCLAEMERLQEIIQSHVDAEAVNNNDDLKHELSEKMAQLGELEIQLLATNQKILNLRKKLDSVPSKSEVNQYRKRFVELYQSIASRNLDIKKFYIFFNSLQDTRLYLKKEINLLDSIFDNLSTAKHSAISKNEFLLQFQQIVDGIIKARINVYDKLTIEKHKRDKLNDEYSKLIEQQRLYTKLLREFKEECHRNEILSRQSTSN